LKLPPDQMQTLTYVMLAFAGQGNLYVLRERGRLWHSRPAPVLLLTSLGDLILVGCLAGAGILMSALPISTILLLVATTAIFTLAMDSIKLATFARLRVD